MLTFAQALEKAQAYSPHPGWNDQERAEMNAFMQQASPEQTAALREVMRVKTRDLLAETQHFIVEVENELRSKVPN